jgi:hypothetical protein
MKILFLHGWQSVLGGVKPTFLKDHGHEVINPALDDDDFDTAVRAAQVEYDQHEPDAIVGSSRGGSVAMNINSRDTPLILLCPAWKNWGTVRRLKSNSSILHSRNDDVIPFLNSEELVSNSSLPPESLIEVGIDHRLADPETLRAMLAACEQHLIGASFLSDFPSAFHCIPLHLVKPIWESRILFSKADLQEVGSGIQRATSGEKDRMLGFHHFIHFYLPKCQKLEFSALPILHTQLKESAISPFPHVVLEVPSSKLRDRDCTICNFNIALSKPKFEGGNGCGMHNRNASADSVLAHWRGFRSSNPSRKALRHSFWHKGLEVPVIAGSRITIAPDKVGSGASPRFTANGNRIKVVELLLQSPFEIPDRVRLHVFSESDGDSLRELFPDLQIQVRDDAGFEWYRESDRVSPTVRKAIDDYFCSSEKSLPELDFDVIR